MGAEPDTYGGVAPLLERLADLRAGNGVVHPRFGDLARADAVCMSATSYRPEDCRVVDDVIIHLTVVGFLFYLVVVLTRRRLIPWHESAIARRDP